MEDKRLEKRLVLKKSVRRFLTQTMLSIILLLITLILLKEHPNLKKDIIKNVYEENIAFTKVRNIYNKYFGSVAPLNPTVEEQAVFNDQISYKSKSNYKDGVKLIVDNNYTVPALNEGIVVFIGEKEGYGNTLIIEQTDGVDVFYSNIDNISVNIYDYINKGTPLGTVKENVLYLVFQKEGKVIDYKEYL